MYEWKRTICPLATHILTPLLLLLLAHINVVDIIVNSAFLYYFAFYFLFHLLHRTLIFCLILFLSMPLYVSLCGYCASLYRILWFSMSQYSLLHRACSRRNSRTAINETEKKSEFSLISRCEEKWVPASYSFDINNTVSVQNYVCHRRIQ